jgi:uncharacterized protein (DUF302 family)
MTTAGSVPEAAEAAREAGAAGSVRTGQAGGPAGPRAAYAFGVRVPYGHGLAVARARAALQAEGFGVLTEIDVQATLPAKVGHHMGRYVVLGACNPGLAQRGMAAEQELGALLPCNPVVYEDREAGGETVVVVQDPQAMLGAVGNPARPGGLSGGGRRGPPAPARGGRPR